jgi:acetyl esterase/lipase
MSISENIGGIEIWRDIPFAQGEGYEDGQGNLDVYRPAAMSGMPVLLHFHGGGLKAGDKSTFAKVAEAMAQEGMVVVSANYRLIPKHIYPAYMEDAATAFDWVYRNIEQYGGGPDKIVVTGGSAGGHIAALLALNETFLQARGLSAKNVKACVPVTGLMNAEASTPERIETTWGDVANARDASPILHVRKDTPPMLLMVADEDLPGRAEENTEMFEAMKRAGNTDIELAVQKDRRHGSIVMSMANKADPARLQVLAFMKKHGAGVSPRR